MNIFKRNHGKSLRQIKIGIALIAVALIVGVLIFFLSKNKANNPITYSEDNVNTSNY